jgi:hypothetical protein
MATTTTFDHRHYVPILKGKEGEYGALKELGAAARELTTPLVEIPPPDAGRPLENVLDRFGQRMASRWGTDDYLFFDLLWDSQQRTTANQHPLRHVADDARNRGLRVIPVTGLARDGGYQAATQHAAARLGHGAAIRLEPTDVQGDPQALAAALDQLLAAIQVAPDAVDLIIDLRAVAAAFPSFLAQAVEQFINAMARRDEWRTLTLASSAFPDNLAGRPAASTIPRHDWELWNAAVARQPRRLPAFGDYAIQSPPLAVYLPYMEPAASVRYATDTEWLILRGRSVRRGSGFSQFHSLSRTLIARPEYRGAAFSWGDAFIDACAQRTSNPGSLTTWRKVGTSHHLELVARQV